MDIVQSSSLTGWIPAFATLTLGDYLAERGDAGTPRYTFDHWVEDGDERKAYLICPDGSPRTYPHSAFNHKNWCIVRMGDHKECW
jgi:hypothetical protein